MMGGDPSMGMDAGAPALGSAPAGAPAAQDPSMGGAAPTPPGFAPQGAENPAMAEGDPSMMGGDPNMMGDDAGMGEEPMPDDMGGENGGDDSTAALLDRLSDDDKEAARKYILSMLDDSEGNGDNMPAPGPEGDGAPMSGTEDEPAPEEAAPLAESIILKKKQFKRLNENIGVGELEKPEKKQHNEPKIHDKNKKSPFRAPRFY